MKRHTGIVGVIYWSLMIIIVSGFELYLPSQGLRDNGKQILEEEDVRVLEKVLKKRVEKDFRNIQKGIKKGIQFQRIYYPLLTYIGGDKEGKQVIINLIGVSFQDIVLFFAKNYGYLIYPDEKVSSELFKKRIFIQSKEPVKVREAFQLLQDFLDKMGLTMTSEGRFIRVVEKDFNKKIHLEKLISLVKSEKLRLEEEEVYKESLESNSEDNLEDELEDKFDGLEQRRKKRELAKKAAGLGDEVSTEPTELTESVEDTEAYTVVSQVEGQPSRWMSMKVLLNFRNTDIDEVLRSYADLSGYTIIKDPSIEGKVTIISMSRVVLSDAFRILEASLSAQGFLVSVDKERRVVRVSSKKSIAKYPTKVREGGKAQIAGDEQRLWTQIVHLKYGNTKKIAETIKMMLSDEGSVIPYQLTNTIILNESTDQVKRLVELIEILDKEKGVKKTKVFRVKNVQAGYVASVLRQIASQYKETELEYSVVADERSKALFVTGMIGALDKVEEILGQIDRPVKKAMISLSVVKIPLRRHDYPLKMRLFPQVSYGEVMGEGESCLYKCHSATTEKQSIFNWVGIRKGVDTQGMVEVIKTFYGQSDVSVGVYPLITLMDGKRCRVDMSKLGIWKEDRGLKDLDIYLVPSFKKKGKVKLEVYQRVISKGQQESQQEGNYDGYVELGLERDQLCVLGEIISWDKNRRREKGVSLRDKGQDSIVSSSKVRGDSKWVEQKKKESKVSKSFKDRGIIGFFRRNKIRKEWLQEQKKRLYSGKIHEEKELKEKQEVVVVRKEEVQKSRELKEEILGYRYIVMLVPQILEDDTDFLEKPKNRVEGKESEGVDLKREGKESEEAKNREGIEEKEIQGKPQRSIELLNPKGFDLFGEGESIQEEVKCEEGEQEISSIEEKKASLQGSEQNQKYEGEDKRICKEVDREKDYQVVKELLEKDKKEKKKENGKEELGSKQEVYIPSKDSTSGGELESYALKNVIYQRGLKLFEQKKYREAIREFATIVNIDPHYKKSREYLKLSQEYFQVQVSKEYQQVTKDISEVKKVSEIPESMEQRYRRVSNEKSFSKLKEPEYNMGSNRGVYRESTHKITTKVVAVGGGGTLIILDKGADHGIVSGMIFNVYRGTRLLTKIKVEDVDRGVSGAYIINELEGDSLQEGDLCVLKEL